MPQENRPVPLESALDARIRGLEERLTRLEARLERTEEPPAREVPMAEVAPVAKIETPSEDTDGEFEFEVGQNWFAVAGIIALALGAGFMLSLPFTSLPAWVPSLGGYVVAAILFLLARVGQRAFELVSSYLRGAGMALLFFATLRLFFFGEAHVLSTASLTGRVLLVAVAALNLGIAWHRRSPWLVGLAVILGYSAVLAIGSPWFVLGAVVLQSAFLVLVCHRVGWPRLAIVGIPLGYFAYLLWAIGNPFFGGALHFVSGPAIAPGFLLVLVAVFAAGSLLRKDRETEGAVPSVGALLNCGLGFIFFLVHMAAMFGAYLVGAQIAASLVFLGLAVLFWMRERSQVSTFLYSMTGYAAMSVAIMKATAVPGVFVWLSLQSMVVVTTAVWFRSRFIVVANFIIYVAVILGYLFVAQKETGISLGFGLVALGSARILNWQKSRLELKTEMMRNSYLLSAFAVFPYALYHLVPGKYVALAWMSLALVYYLLNLVVQNRKYRWMGHTTLLLTTLYVVVIGISRFEPVYRIISFLVLGTVLLIVSLSFTRLRKRQRGQDAEPPQQ